jgi:S1-C subfamily serine protease
MLLTRHRTAGRFARVVRLALSAVVAAGAVVLPAGTAVAKPTFTAAEKAAAIVRPAVVYIEVQWEGWVRDRVSGKLWDTDSVTLTAQCSGFAVSNDGFIVTAGHCVDPGVEGVAVSFFEEIAARYLKAGLVTSGQTQALIDDMVDNAEIEGKAAGEPAIRKVFAQRGVAKSGLAAGDAIPARVVSFHPVSGGDVTLLKVEKSNQPMVTLARSADINIGTDVLAIGYPASADSISDATLEPSNKDGKISNRRTEGGVPFYETSAATTQGMSGGPVANLDGDIIGLISHGPAAEKQAFNFLAASSLIAEELAKAGVKNTLGKIDNDYRDGLNEYYEGHYTAAIEKFDSVLATVPSHAQAQEYRQQAVALRETEGDTGNLSAGLVVILGAIAGFLIIAAAVVVLLVLRSRQKARQPAGYRLAPVIYPPISAGPALAESPTAPPISAPPAAPPVFAPPAGPPVQVSSAPPVPVPQHSPVATVTSQLVAPPAPSIVYCSNCGNGSPPGTKFCSTCGQQFT